MVGAVARGFAGVGAVAPGFAGVDEAVAPGFAQVGATLGLRHNRLARANGRLDRATAA